MTRWIDSARHPTLKRRYTELVYQPMLELLGFLQRNDFKVFIVSGGGVEFMRAWVIKKFFADFEAVPLPSRYVPLNAGNLSYKTLRAQSALKRLSS